MTLRKIAICIGCGCDDNHACPFGCYWLRVDYEDGKGVCSECVDHCEAWDQGDRTSHAEPIAEIEAELLQQQTQREPAPEQEPPPADSPCSHSWPYIMPAMDDRCRWCGMTFARYVHTECI